MSLDTVVATFEAGEFHTGTVPPDGFVDERGLQIQEAIMRRPDVLDADAPEKVEDVVNDRVVRTLGTNSVDAALLARDARVKYTQDHWFRAS